MNALPQIPLEGVIETPFLAQKAGAIRALAKNVARDIADLEATMPIDDKTGSKPIRKMFEREFYKALCRREESLRRETAQTQRMRATYEAFRPIWREHPEWTVEQCDEEYRRREMEAVAQATG